MILYVDPPAFGLKSSNSSCLAAIAYCNLVAPESFSIDYSASASLLTTGCLPTLHDTGSDAWFGGFNDIVAHLRTMGLDAEDSLDPVSRAESLAYAALLASKAHDLTCLSLFADEENYAACTRKALSQNLPFPRNYTAPHNLQVQAIERVSNLTLETRSPDVGSGLFQGRNKAALRLQARQIRIQNMADDLYTILESKLSHGPFFFGQKASSIDCQIYGHLALHLYPEVPNDFLAKRLKETFPRTWKFVIDFHTRFLEEQSSQVVPTSSFTITGFCKSIWAEMLHGHQYVEKKAEVTEKDSANKAKEWRSKAFFIGSALSVLIVFVLSNNMIVIDTGSHEEYEEAEVFNDEAESDLGDEIDEDDIDVD